MPGKVRGQALLPRAHEPSSSLTPKELDHSRLALFACEDHTDSCLVSGSSLIKDMKIKHLLQRGKKVFIAAGGIELFIKKGE